MSGRPQPEGIGKEILFATADNIAVVTLNRPDKRNAVNVALAEALTWAVEQIELDPEIRVAILASSLPSTFCAGADLAEIAAGNGKALTTTTGGIGGFPEAAKKTPWIAAVRGNVLAGGFELVMGCDMIVAGEDARFGLPEAKRGLIAGGGGAFRLPRLIPRAIALEMLATGDPIDAARAYELGLINRVVASDTVLEEAKALARTIAANAPLAVAANLSVARLAHDTTIQTLRMMALEAGIINSRTEDAKEGPRAFLEKRAPVWKAR
ncbi:MAG: enoyl-CoA hydratase-related protein [Tardiphaga sp.]